MDKPYQLSILGLVDAVIFLLLLAMGGMLVSQGAFPFNLVMGGALVLFLVQVAYMLYTLFFPSTVGYFDHHFLYLPLFLFIGQSNPLIFAPVFFLWFSMLMRPAVRRYFSLRPKFLFLFRFSEGTLVFWAILVCVGARLVSDGGFPFMRECQGFMAAYMNPTLWPAWLGGGIFLALAVWKGWTWSFFPAPIFAGCLLLPYLSMGSLVMTLFCLFWCAPENRERFAPTWNPAFLLFFTLIVWLPFAGMANALVPVGSCPKHGVPLFLYQVWKTPLIMESHKNDVAYRLTQTQSANRVQTNCSTCERGIVHRNEAAACRKMVADARDKLAATYREFPAASGSIHLVVKKDGLEMQPLAEGLLERFRQTLGDDLRFPCPYEVKLASQGVDVNAVIRGYVFTVGAQPEPEGQCLFCENDGL